MSNPIEQYMPQAPARIGQGTAVEQSRAVAEVQAAIVVAQQCPRNVQAAVAEMRQSCQQKGLAERAFFRYSRGGSTVSGPSVHLARELARCWGNIQYGLAELRRDDEYGESEMQAFAWDVQTNARSSQVFIVPHKRDVKGGPKKLVDLRDIYENNANNGARRLREAIFSVLPAWFVEEAKDICTRTITNGGGKPLPQRIADAVRMFEGMGVTVDRIEAKLGRASGKWTEFDVAQLGVTYKSVQRGEVTLDEEFPAERVTVAEITKLPSPQPAETAATAESAAWPQVAQAGGAE
ncbi:hypothetical protein ABT093_09970 [Kitasatospora sp. NPDC002551]|uniref:hypothetical protein n=1 Tax=Kitasatospora sp. NPDC002551 TaxID=3154539 RepID=UPI00333002C7